MATSVESIMDTYHRVVTADSRTLTDIPTDSVELVVTSPPYPMIEMWDDLFAELNPTISGALADGDADKAFEQMHAELDQVWRELRRVLVDGGIACINVGDATRKLDDSFRVYQNHARIIDAFTDLGFTPLPEILWRKPVNSTTKFLGSGMLPPNAYVTLEHEYILVFRNGSGQRQFESKAQRRYQSAYFWEERNQWFSDVWMDITGELQALEQGDLRDRSGAFPFEIPYRLINMYSVYDDTILDPFWGTGTTSLAAMVAARDSIGMELNEEFVTVFRDRVGELPAYAANVVERRLQSHREFVTQRQAAGQEFDYAAENYDFPVVTRQEQPIQFYTIGNITETSEGYTVHHHPVTADDIEISEAR